MRSLSLKWLCSARGARALHGRALLALHGLLHGFLSKLREKTRRCSPDRLSHLPEVREMVVELTVNPPIEESSALMTLTTLVALVASARVVSARSSPPFPPPRALQRSLKEVCRRACPKRSEPQNALPNATMTALHNTLLNGCQSNAGLSELLSDPLS